MSDISSISKTNKNTMEKLVDDNFQCATTEDRNKIKEILYNIGVDCKEDLIYISEEILRDKLKVIHIRKLLALRDQILEEKKLQGNGASGDQSETNATERNEKTKNLAIATGVLGGVTAVAAPLAVFAALFPPITLPVAVVAGATAGVIAAATAGTGIATAVTAHKSKEEEDSCRDDDSGSSESKKLL